MYLALKAQAEAESLIGRTFKSDVGNVYRVLQADGERVQVERTDGVPPLGGGATYWFHYSSLTQTTMKEVS